MTYLRLLPWLPLLALASCSTGGKSDNTTASTSSAYKPLSQRIAESNGYSRDSTGGWAANTDKRSSFESNRNSPYFKGEYNKKDFKPAHNQKAMWSKDEFARTSYAGQTDGSRFQQASSHQGLTHRESGASARVPDHYQTGNYGTSAAREAGSTRLDRQSDAETDSRRRVFTPPAVIDWQAQRQMTMENARGILGR